MHNLQDSIIESLLSNERDLINNKLSTNGIYILTIDGDIIKFANLDSMTPLDLYDNEPAEAIGFVKDKYAVWISLDNYNGCFAMTPFNVSDAMKQYKTGDNKFISKLNNDGLRKTKMYRKVIDDPNSIVNYDYHTKHLDEWYIGTIEEMTLLNKYDTLLNMAMDAVGGDKFGRWYWTSTMFNDNSVTIFNWRWHRTSFCSINIDESARFLSVIDIKKISND